MVKLKIRKSLNCFSMLLKSKLSQIFSHGETENKEKFKLLFYALEIKTVSKQSEMVKLKIRAS